jgi:putative membrane protein
MLCARNLLLAACVCVAATAAIAQSPAPLSDAEISQALNAAMQAEIDAANLALSKSQNASVRAFAAATRAAYGASVSQAPASSVKPQDNPVSQPLSGAASERAEKLAKLSETAFDAAYARNELEHDVLVTGALEATLIPLAKDPQLKRLLQNELAVFQGQRASAQRLADQFQSHARPTPDPPRRDHQ